MWGTHLNLELTWNRRNRSWKIGATVKCITYKGENCLFFGVQNKSVKTDQEYKIKSENAIILSRK